MVQVLFHQANKRGHPLVKVTYQATLINTTHVDLLSLLDRERLHAHCSAEEDKVEWLQRFMLVADDLSTRKTDTQARILTITWLSTVQPARVEYLWKPYLPQGRPVGLVGDPGVGKSALVMKIAAHVTTGLAFPSLIDGVIPHDFPHETCCFSRPRMTWRIPCVHAWRRAAVMPRSSVTSPAVSRIRRPERRACRTST